MLNLGTQISGNYINHLEDLSKMKCRFLLNLVVPLFFVLFVLSGDIVVGQSKAEAKFNRKEFCSQNYSSSDRGSFQEIREFTVSASGALTVDGGKNGGIRIEGSDRSDILVRACVNAWGDSDEAAKALASSIKVDTGSVVKAASDNNEERKWSVSYEIFVPKNTDLSLTARNGGIGIKSVNGTMNFETMNGGVSLIDLSGNVRGRTTNGGIGVALTGNTWKGLGIDVATTNGGVNLSVPENYSANFEAGTTNGVFKSNVPSLEVTQEDILGKTDSWSHSKRVRASMNGGGPNIRVVTTNGGVKIDSSGS